MKKELEFKFNTNYATEMKTKMTIITNLKAAKGAVFVMILLKKIAMARDLFILKFEQGEETFIPIELSQDKLPASFRFYDPLIQTI